MRKIKTRKVKHRCSIPYCNGLNVTAVTRAGSFASAPPIYLCDNCIGELIALQKVKKKPKSEEHVSNQGDGVNSEE